MSVSASTSTSPAAVSGGSGNGKPTRSPNTITATHTAHVITMIEKGGFSDITVPV